ncbi:erythromycin esterase family protein [Thalassotalea sp. G2M2-11]|uniref:erythromycin esterase family protein n=1 Tax=Thalassotalea sp. G2M2-11 TaxID=2787627 RepID=UPI0019D10E77|nr:erythromycin esterase family protein [Thalassotalea sp. G2M2-11]
MKYFNLLSSCLLLLCFLPAIAQTQLTLSPFTTVSLTDDQDFSDLSQFGKQIRNKNIVYLDELTHGEHEVFALKSRLVKYLHQQHGFDVLLLESGFFDVQEIWKNTQQSLASQALGNVFFAYAKDQAFLSLLNYIDQQRASSNPLAVTGFDGRLSGEQSIKHFVHRLKSQLDKLPQAQQLLANWPVFSKMLQASIARKPLSFSNNETKGLLQHGYHIIDALIAADKQPQLDSPAYFARLLAGVLRLIEVDYQIRRFDEHDLVMANNIDWLLTHVYPNKKVIIWGHYVHVNKQGYITNRYHNVATALASKYASKSYHVNIAGLSGSYRNYIDGSVNQLPLIDKPHLAADLTLPFKHNNQAVFIQPAQFKAKQYQEFSLFGHGYQSEHQIKVKHWQSHFDASFLIKQVSPSP